MTQGPNSVLLLYFCRYGDVADAAVAAANWQGGHVSQGLSLQLQHNPTPSSANPGRGTSGSQQQRPNPSELALFLPSAISPHLSDHLTPGYLALPAKVVHHSSLAERSCTL